MEGYEGVEGWRLLGHRQHLQPPLHDLQLRVVHEVVHDADADAGAGADAGGPGCQWWMVVLLGG